MHSANLALAALLLVRGTYTPVASPEMNLFMNRLLIYGVLSIQCNLAGKA